MLAAQSFMLLFLIHEQAPSHPLLANFKGKPAGRENQGQWSIHWKFWNWVFSGCTLLRPQEVTRKKAVGSSLRCSCCRMQRSQFFIAAKSASGARSMSLTEQQIKEIVIERRIWKVSSTKLLSPVDYNTSGSNQKPPVLLKGLPDALHGPYKLRPTGTKPAVTWYFSRIKPHKPCSFMGLISWAPPQPKITLDAFCCVHSAEGATSSMSPHPRWKHWSLAKHISVTRLQHTCWRVPEMEQRSSDLQMHKSRAACQDCSVDLQACSNALNVLSFSPFTPFVIFSHRYMSQTRFLISK